MQLDRAKITKWILCFDCFVGGERLRLALVIDGLDPEEVLVPLLQPLDRAAGRLRRGPAHRHPLPRLLVHLLDEVLLDREAAVVLGGPPGQLTAVLGDPVDFEGPHGRPRPAEEHELDELLVFAVDVGGGDLVAGAVLARAAGHGELCVVLGVLNGDVVRRGDLGAHEGPHGVGAGLAGDVDVQLDSAAHFGGFDAVNVGPVDPGLHCNICKPFCSCFFFLFLEVGFRHYNTKNMCISKNYHSNSAFLNQKHKKKHIESPKF